MSTKNLGYKGEQIALQWLEARGFQLREQNWHCRAGEIDLICWQECCLVFIEVKTRRSSYFAKKYLFETITAQKKKRLKLLAEIYLAYRHKRNRPEHRIDMVGVILSPIDESIVDVTHLKGVL